MGVSRYPQALQDANIELETTKWLWESTEEQVVVLVDATVQRIAEQDWPFWEDAEERSSSASAPRKRCCELHGRLCFFRRGPSLKMLRPGQLRSAGAWGHTVGAGTVLRAGREVLPSKLLADVAAKLDVIPQAIREFEPSVVSRGPCAERELFYARNDWRSIDEGPMVAHVRRVWRPLRIRRPPRSLRQRFDLGSG